MPKRKIDLGDGIEMEEETTGPAPVVIETHAGVEIRFLPTFDEFVWSVEGHKRHHGHIRDARKAIDTYLKNQFRLSREDWRIPVVAEDGRTAVITRLHAGTAAMITQPVINADRFDNISLYVDTPTVRKLVERKIALEREVEWINKNLEGAEVSSPDRYDDDHAKTADKFTPKFLKSVERVKAAAAKLEGKVYRETKEG